MEVLRIILTQSSANYKKEETVLNKMTYPLPVFSTIIGAFHSACGYKEYHPMEISVQGKYESMHKEPYTDYCFLNSIMDDRGFLVKMKNENFLSMAFNKVAKAKKPQGNSFRKGVTIDVINEDLLYEYRSLKDLSEKFAEFKTTRIDKVIGLLKKRKKALADKKNKCELNSLTLQLISKRDKEIKELEKTINMRLKEYAEKELKTPYSKFASITTSLKYYEVLNNVELILHVKSDKDTLNDIKDNIYNMKSIGRSEDFIDVQDVCFVNLVNDVQDEVISEYSAYLDYDLVRDGYINLKVKTGNSADGTKYYINKNYRIEDNKRIFEKKKVVYASQYAAEAGAENLWFDVANEKTYIVCFN